MKQATLSAARRQQRRAILVIIILALFAYFLATQHDDLTQSLRALRTANTGLVGLALACFIGTYLAAAMVYVCIAVKPLLFGRTLLVQVASGFTNRLLPGGFGGLATFARYLITQKHSATQAAAIVSINNLLGFVGIIVLTLTVALESHTPLRQAFSISLPTWLAPAVLGLLAAAALVTLVVPIFRKRLAKLLRTLKTDLRVVAANPARLVTGLFFSVLVTVSYAAVLYACIFALGESASVLQTIIVLTIGVTAASVTPTPGGVGGAEAGLVAGLASIGISAGTGLSIALLYRLVTFWLPILPGFVGFRVALKKKLL